MLQRDVNEHTSRIVRRQCPLYAADMKFTGMILCAPDALWTATLARALGAPYLLHGKESSMDVSTRGVAVCRCLRRLQALRRDTTNDVPIHGRRAYHDHRRALSLPEIHKAGKRRRYLALPESACNAVQKRETE